MITHEKSESKRTNLLDNRPSLFEFRRKEFPNKWLWYGEREGQVWDYLPAKFLKRVPGSSPISLYRHDRTEYAFIRLFPRRLTQEIAASQDLLRLQDNWDENDSPGYSRSTWNRAVKFLLRNVLQLSGRHHAQFEAPRILPGPEGSIDLHWRTRKRELLINIPANAKEPASYYGDDREEGTENAIRGKNLDTSADNGWIFLWLTK